MTDKTTTQKRKTSYLGKVMLENERLLKKNFAYKSEIESLNEKLLESGYILNQLLHSYLLVEQELQSSYKDVNALITAYEKATKKHIRVDINHNVRIFEVDPNNLENPML